MAASDEDGFRENASRAQGEATNPTPRGVVGGVFDKRLTPARRDVAADYLKGRVDAERYERGRAYQVVSSASAIRRTPDPVGAQETQILFGEVFTVYDEAEGWAWGQAAIDGYVGYVETTGLDARVDVPTHRVTALRTHRFSKPDLKSPPAGHLSMNAKLAVPEVSGDGKWCADGRGAWVFSGHLAPLDRPARDPVAVAEAYLGTPYLWGGRESLGLDCSALLQTAYEMIGAVPPRDADLQELWFTTEDRGMTLWQADGERDWRSVPLRRGDIVYWSGHTGVMTGPSDLLHANATSMAVTRDPLVPFADHLEKDEGSAVTRFVRPAAPDILRSGLRGR